MFQRLLRSEFSPGRDPARSSRDGGWSGFGGLRTFVPLVVVFVALASLTIIGAVLERDVSNVRREVTRLTDPGRSSVREIQILLAREAAGIRGYLLTDDTMFLVSHVAARAARKAAVADLGRLVHDADPRLRQLATQLALQLEPADAVLDSLHDGLISHPEFLLRLPRQQQRFEAITETTRLLGGTLSSMAAQRFAKAHRTHRMALIAGAPIMVLAVLAVILVAELSVGYRSLAAQERSARTEADAARVQADERRLEVERLADSRSRLVRGFTHDVKNPLGAALGVLTLVDEGMIAPRDGVARAKRSLSSAVRLIEDLLRQERNASGDIVVTRAPTDLRALALECAEEWRAAAEAKGLGLTVDVPDEIPLMESDADKVRQILGNLVSNAITYTHAGAITIRVAVRDAAAANDRARWAVIDVHDTGPGIPADQQRQLFQEFRRLDTSAGTSGHGIGLANSQRLAAALGGHISVESEVGVGSSFILLLPCERCAASESPPLAVRDPETRAVVREKAVASTTAASERSDSANMSSW